MSIQINNLNQIKWLYKFRNNIELVKENLYDFLIYNIYSPLILREWNRRKNKIPNYINAQVPSFFKSLMEQTLSNEQLQEKIHFFWINKAIQVLSGYQACSIPLSEDNRVEKITYNLLSPKGRNWLYRFKHFQEQGQVPINTGHEAFYAANKFLLDLDLFISLGYLRNCSLLNNAQQSNLTISMSSGCYNGCCHCGYEAKGPVSHMPYPILLKLYFLFDKQTHPAYLYADSDPISYRDPIIGADCGDVIHYVSLKGQFMPSFITKGPLKKENNTALAKVMEKTPVLLSLIDLPGERDVEQNKRRIEEVFDIAKDIPKERLLQMPIVRRYSFDELSKKEKTFQQGVPSFCGRWVDTWTKLKLSDNQKGGNNFADNGVIIKSSGEIYGVSQNLITHRFEWQKLGNIFSVHSQKLKISHFNKYISLKMASWQYD